MKKLIGGIFVIVSIALLGVLPVVFARESMAMKGSDTMVNLGQAWAEAFMSKNPSALIAVTGGGSGTGVAALINGTCQIAQSSRTMSQQEFDLARSKGLHVQEIPVAIDALAVVVHPTNPVRQVTIEQLSDVFTGKVTNWKELGGHDEPILVLSRERNSGTHVYFLEEVVRKGNKNGSEEFAPTVLMMPSSQAIEQEIAANRVAIGYFGLGYLNDRVRALNLFDKKSSTFQAPALENVVSGRYPLSRSLLFYLPRPPDGIVKEFVNFVLSEEGQAIVLDMHFVPLQKSST